MTAKSDGQQRQQEQNNQNKHLVEMSELARLEKRMERRWYDLAMAEQRGQPTHVLERMYDAYLRALDSYIAQQRQMNGENASSRLAS